MPLNMNTVGTGTGIGVGANNSGSYVIRDTSVESIDLISAISDQTISKISFNNDFQTTQIQYDSNSQLNNWYCDAVMYNGDLYTLHYSSSLSKSILTKFTFSITSYGNTFVRTEIQTPTGYHVSGYTKLIQLGSYLYMFGSSNDLSTQLFLYRFDGTSFTDMNPNKKEPFKYFFDTTVSNVGSSIDVVINPMSSTTYEGCCCLIDVCFGINNEYPYGYTGIFVVDDNGFQMKQCFHLTGYYGSTSYAKYNTSSAVISDNNRFYMLEFANKQVTLTEYTINYTVDSNSPNYYTRSYTKASTNKVLVGSISNMYCYCDFCNLSYPQFDTFIIVVHPKTSYYGDYDFSETNTKWFLCKIRSGKLETSSITATSYLRTSSNYGSRVYFVTNANQPYVIMGGEYRSDSSYTNTFYASVQTFNMNATYSSDVARLRMKIKLLTGDIVYCDDGIISMTCDSNTVEVNATRFNVPSDGIYTIITKVYDAYEYPSIIITDKSGAIVYIRTDIQDDGSMIGYLLKGMKVNGSAVIDSHKTIYGPSDRYLISMK